MDDSADSGLLWMTPSSKRNFHESVGSIRRCISIARCTRDVPILVLQRLHLPLRYIQRGLSGSVAQWLSRQIQDDPRPRLGHTVL